MAKILSVGVIILILLSGCHGSSGGSDVPAPSITFNDIETDGATLQPGIPFDILYSISSDSEFSGEKIVSFYLLRNVNEEADDGTEDPVEYSDYLASTSLDYLAEGESSLTLSAVLPDDLSSSGQYYITGRIADASDGLTGYDDVFSSDGIDVDLASQNTSNIVMVDFTLDQENVVVDDDSDIETTDALPYPYHGNTEVFGNLTLNSLNNAEEDLVVRVMINVDGVWENIELWNSETESFEESLTVSLEEGTANQTFGFDMNFPDELVAKIQASADASDDNGFIIRAYVDPDDVLPEVSEDDNYIDTYVDLFLYPETWSKATFGGFYAEKEFSPMIGSKKWLGAKSSFNFQAGVDAVPARATAAARFKLPVFVRSTEIGLAQVDLNAQYGLIPLDRGIELTLKWQGAKLYGKQLAGSGLSFEIIRDWYQEKDFFSGRVVVGPVPLRFSVGAKGGVGFEVAAGVTNKLSLYGRLPRIDLGLYGRGGLDLTAVEAGVEVNGNLATVDCYATAETNLSYNVTGGNSTLLNAAIDLEASYIVELLSARFGLYVITPKVKWCKKWRVSYPCGLEYARPINLWFLSTPAAYKKQGTMLKKKLTWTP